MTCVSSTRVETDVELQSTAFGFVSASKAPIRADSAVGAVNYAILSVAHAQEGFAKEYGISAVRSSMPIVGASFGPPTLSEISSLTEVKAFDIHPKGVEIALNESIRDAYEFINRGVFSVFRQRLWKHPTIAEGHTQKWDKFAARSDSEGVWSFWKKWYQGFLDGKPLDWELQRRVALIADDIWDAGPEAVAAKIREIEAKWALEREIASLKEQLVEAKQVNALPSRLHNQPPEAIDDTQTAFRTDVSLIRNKLEELEEEVQKPEPSPSKLLKIAAWISDQAVAIAKYCGAVADETLRAGSKAFASAAGKTAGAATVAAVSLPDGMKTLAELIEKLVAVIGG